MALLNDFKLGADPEFVLYNNTGNILPSVHPEKYSPWGIDHGGWVVEPHPKPALSVRELVQNLKTAMNDYATVAPQCDKWRAGAYLKPEQRVITLGGHVHIDKPRHTDAQAAALDIFTKHLEALDILPKQECVERRGAGNYGRWSDFRVEHGHFEYRTMPSWLFSQRVTKICLLGTKLTVVDPDAPYEVMGRPTGASLLKLKAFFERFKGKDDDVDWILATGVLNRKLNLKPDRDLRDVWTVKAEKEAPRWKELEAAANKALIQERVRAARTRGAGGAGGTDPFEGTDFDPEAIWPYCRVARTVAYYRLEDPTGTGGWFNLPTDNALTFDAPNRLMEGVTIVPIGEIGQPWAPVNVGRRRVYNTVQGRTYAWYVMAIQGSNDAMYNALRAWVQNGMHRARTGLQVLNGLAFEFIREM